jgi:hypothetical protein
LTGEISEVVLTIIAITGEEHVVADKVRSAAEVSALGYKDLLHKREGVNHNTFGSAQGEAVDITIVSRELCEGSEGVVTVREKVEIA